MEQMPDETVPDIELPEAPLSTRIGLGLGGGALIGVALLLVGLARGVVVLVFGAHIATSSSDDLHFALGYVAAFAVAGGVTLAFWPLRKTLIGAYALGYMNAGIVSTAIALMFAPRDSTGSATFIAVVIAIMTLAFGTAVGSAIRSSEEDAVIRRRMLMRRLRAEAKARNRTR